MNIKRYTQWQKIGEGNFANVFRVYDEELGMRVAVKLIKKDHQASRFVMDSLRSEVRISRQLRHPNICPIHDLYEGENGVGIIMDLIEGIESKKWFADNKNRILSTVGQRLAYLKGIAKGLEVAHTMIVHRDLKPANVLLKGSDPANPVILDFGIAVLSEASGSQKKQFAGTFKYTAPEQFETPDLVDKLADLFAFGIIAYEVFTGRIPPVSLRKVMKTKEVPRIDLMDITPPSAYCSAVPPALDRVIVQLLAYRREDRPQSAAEIIQVLDTVDLDFDSSDATYSTITQAPAGSSRNNEVISIPEGDFYLGTRGSESKVSNEKPCRRVHVSAFRMDAYPVTNKEFREFLDSTGYDRPPLIDDPIFGRDDSPVVAVTWDDANIFAKWAGGTLPTEAQWEYAAKGGAKFKRYPWGDNDPTPTLANINGVSTSTSSVRSCPSGVSAFGVYDMCGNAWEWCLDPWFTDYYVNLTNEVTDPICLAKSGERSLRGGSFDTMFATMGRCAFRFNAPMEERRPSVGFRLVYL